jgi:hypothetical protein
MTDGEHDPEDGCDSVPVVPAPEPEPVENEHALCELCGETVALKDAIPGRCEEPVHRRCYVDAYGSPEWLLD